MSRSDGRPLLHVQLVGFANGPWFPVGVLCGPSLVLAKSATSYNNDSELGAIRTYIGTT